MEQLVEQLFPHFRCESVEGVAGRVSESCAETENILKLFLRIERDRLG